MKDSVHKGRKDCSFHEFEFKLKCQITIFSLISTLVSLINIPVSLISTPVDPRMVSFHLCARAEPYIYLYTKYFILNFRSVTTSTKATRQISVQIDK